MKLSKTLLTIVAVVVFTVFAGCDSQGVGSDDTVRVTLSIMAVNSGPAAKSASSTAEVTAAKVLLRTIQFHARDLDEETEGVEFRSDPLVAVLDLNGMPIELTVAEIPFGTYHKVSFRIHKPEDGQTPPDSDFKIGESGNERFSVIVDGMLDGFPFQYRSSKSMQQQVDFEEDLVIDETMVDVKVTLLVDVSTWFMDDDGNELDPTDDSASNTSRIGQSIRESFRIFKDNNKDGHAD